MPRLADQVGKARYLAISQVQESVYERLSAISDIHLAQVHHRKPDAGFPSTISINRFSHISSARRFSSMYSWWS